MKTRRFTANEGSKLISTEELMLYAGVGRNTAMKFGEAAGAKIKFGKRVLWDKDIINNYIAELRENTAAGAR
jgi:hypothetical protein